MSNRGGMKGKRAAWRSTTMVTALSLLATLAAPAGAYLRPGETRVASLTNSGAQGDDLYGHFDGANSDMPWVTSLSTKGRYVAFTSTADNLVEGDTNTVSDIFVRDVLKGTTERVSVTSSGQQAEGACDHPDLCPHGTQRGVGGLGIGLRTPILGSHDSVITPSGRFVAFSSFARNLGAQHGLYTYGHVYLHDRRKASTELISVSTEGDPGDDDSGEWASGHFAKSGVSVSSDGRFVLFASLATNLHANDDNNALDFFVRDRQMSETILGAAGSKGELLDQGAECATLSGNGRYVFFGSRSTNVDDGDDSLGGRLYRRDLRTGAIRPVPHGTAHCVGLSSSPDGRFIAFAIPDGAGVPNDNNLGGDVFVYDFATERMRRISVTSSGQQANTHPEWRWNGVHVLSHFPVISANGRYVVFESNANDLSPHGRDREPEQRPLGDYDSDIYVHDLDTGATEWMSHDPRGREADECILSQDGNRRPHWLPTIDTTGRYVAFYSCSMSLVDGDENGESDVFVRDRGTPLGAGGLEGSGDILDPEDFLCIGEICVPPTCVGQVCLPPGAVFSSDETDDLNEALTEQGANIYSASLAYRPQYEDLFAAIEIEHMPNVIPGSSPIFYGLRFSVEEKEYEVRATSLLGGTFGLFDCTDSPACSEVAELRGGYGTTGERIVFALPLDDIGMSDGGKLKDVVAFSGFGNSLAGAAKILDRVRFN